MHARELLELAAMVSTHGLVLVRGVPAIPEMALQQYWSASKSRLDRWGRTLKTSTGLAAQDAAGAEARWRVFWDVLVEILASEVLTRAWTAVVTAHDRLHDWDEAEPIARSVYLGHLEARCRVLNFLSHAWKVFPVEAAALDRFRTRCDRWSNWLVGRIGAEYDVCDFAADPQRAADFARQLQSARTSTQDSTAWRLLLGSLLAGFRNVHTSTSPNYDLNLSIASSILGCFTPDLFDGTGILRSAWLDLFLHPVDDAQLLIEDLFQAESTVEILGSARRQNHVRRWWRYGGP